MSDTERLSQLQYGMLMMRSPRNALEADLLEEFHSFTEESPESTTCLYYATGQNIVVANARLGGSFVYGTQTSSIFPVDDEASETLEQRFSALEARVAVLEQGPTEDAVGPRLDEAVSEAFRLVDGVDGVMRPAITSPRVVLFVLAREHGIVDREQLFEIEEELSEKFPAISVELKVRAHQGHAFSRVAPGSRLIYLRG